MNEIVNEFLLQGDKIGMPEAHLRQPGFTFLLVDHSPEINNKFKNLKKQEI